MRLNPYIRSSDRSLRRVVITGVGVLAPNGSDIPSFWTSVVEGLSAVDVITRFPTGDLPTRIGAEVRDFDFKKFLPDARVHRFDRAVQFALAAGSQAVADAGIDIRQLDPDRVGLVEGTSVTGLESLFRSHRNLLQKGYRSISPLTFINAYTGCASGELALHLGVRGHAVTLCSGSASGNDAIGYGLQMIESDEVDLMVAGGAEVPLILELFSGFCVTKVMTRRNEDPKAAVRPFDKDRDGFALGEAAAFVVLEELGHARQRGARIYAEVLGHGRSCEAYHSVAPHPEGLGMRRAMERALRHARMTPDEIDYINAHGTATPTNDPAEAHAIAGLFAGSGNRPGVSSTKPVTGHALGAAGALETVICALAVHHELAPLTANLTAPEPGPRLDFIQGESRAFPIRAAMNLSVGFGGKNSCLILGRPPA